MPKGDIITLPEQFVKSWGKEFKGGARSIVVKTTLDGEEVFTRARITVDLRSGKPVLMVADRANKRIQNFTMDGKHIGFVERVSLPCHFSELNGVVVVPELDARVSLLDRKEPRDRFTPGKFVCPHGACFDHNGNILVVEWVEVGRVTKLRHIT